MAKKTSNTKRKPVKDKKGKKGGKASKMQAKLKAMRERVKQRAKERDKGGMKLNLPDGVEFFKPEKAGTYLLDIIPYEVTSNTNPEAEKGDLWHRRKVFTHFGVGPENKSVICLATMGKACPVCEHAKSLDDPDEAKELRASKKEIYNVIDLSDKKRKIKILEFSAFNFGNKIEDEIETRAEEGEDVSDYADITQGRTLKVRFKQDSFAGTKFFKADRIDFEDRDDQYDESILDDVVDLDEALNVMSHKELEKLFYGGDAPKDEDEDEDDDDGNDGVPYHTDSGDEEGEDEDEDEEEEDDDGEEEEEDSDENENEDEEDEDDEETDDEDEDEEDDDDNPCPEGMTYGTDFETVEECDECDAWSECNTEAKRLKKEKAKKKGGKKKNSGKSKSKKKGKKR